MTTDEPKRGRPRKPDAKVLVSLRISPDILEAMKKGGPGWQSHANDVLRLAYLSGPNHQAAPAVSRMAVKPKLRIVGDDGPPIDPPSPKPGAPRRRSR